MFIFSNITILSYEDFFYLLDYYLNDFLYIIIQQHPLVQLLWFKLCVDHEHDWVYLFLVLNLLYQFLYIGLDIIISACDSWRIIIKFFLLMM